MATFAEMPDSVLLEVFSYLPVRDRIRMSRVCHRWKRLVDDRWLWRHVDLTLYTMRPKIMWHLLRRYMASRLHSLRMGGYLFLGSQAPQLSPALMRALGQKCPNLQRLCLHVADLSMVPITSLPCTLRTLELHSCEISMAWLVKEQDPTVLPLLECIVLDRVPAFRDEHLQGLTRFRALRSLVLGGTYRVTETGLDAGLQELSYLQRLEVLGCTLSADSTLLAISLHLRGVRKIRLTVRGLSAPGLAILEGMPALESLCLLGPLITPEMPSPAEILSSCLTMPRLRVLELQGLGWEGQEAEKILSVLVGIKASCGRERDKTVLAFEGSCVCAAVPAQCHLSPGGELGSESDGSRIADKLVTKLSDLRGHAVGFYQEARALLDHAQKILYRDVMMGSCGNLASVGYCLCKPNLLTQGE
ncbi:F-Box/Lrr-Repeat Protein 12 [Manis pentadactyla]|nr:F-Box/Lrr-Repeat Protein 12 [Manis pentadactyla]